MDVEESFIAGLAQTKLNKIMSGFLQVLPGVPRQFTRYCYLYTNLATRYLSQKPFPEAVIDRIVRPEEIYQRYQQGETVRALAQSFGFTVQYIR